MVIFQSCQRISELLQPFLDPIKCCLQGVHTIHVGENFLCGVISLLFWQGLCPCINKVWTVELNWRLLQLSPLQAGEVDWQA